MADIVRTNKKVKYMILFVTIVSAFAGCIYGLDLGAISGALLLIQKEMNLTAGQMGMIVGAVLGGGSIAIVITGFLADLFGRKNMIVVSAVIFIAGVIMSSTSHQYSTLLTGRIVMGIGVGISAILVPLYLTETTPARLRGKAVATFQLFLTAGILLAYLIDLAFIKSGNWRAMFLILGIPGILLFVGALFLPESPVWLFMKGKFERSKRSILKLHTLEECDIKLHEMQQLLEENRCDKNKTIFKKVYVIPFLIAFLIACLNQTTGINSILQYAPTIFKESGVHLVIVSMQLGTVATLINFIVTVIAIVLIDKLGRKPLLVFSTGGMAVSLLLLALASFLVDSEFKVILLTAGIFSFIITYAIGAGVVVWLAMSELLPTAIRSRGLGICLFANSMVSTLLASVFVILQRHIGYTGIFLTLAGFTVIYFIIAVFYLPETKGKTIEEIEEYFRTFGCVDESD